MYDSRSLKQVQADSAREQSLSEFVEETKQLIQKGGEDGFEPDEVAIERIQRIAKARSTTWGMVELKAELLPLLEEGAEDDLLATLVDDAATGAEKIRASILLDVMQMQRPVQKK